MTVRRLGFVIAKQRPTRPKQSGKLYFFFATIYCGLDSHGSSRRASLRNAWGWMAGQTAPDPLARTMIDVIQKSLVLCRRDERAAFCFARLVISRPSIIRNGVAKLPWPVAEACWRLINLLEYLADLDGEEAC